jgi:hypothetical protein
MKKRAWLNYLAIFGVFLVVVMFFTAASALTSFIKGGTANIGDEFAWSAIRWFPWAIYTPFILRLLRRFPVEKSQLKRSLPVHIGACAVFMLGINILYVWYSYYGKPYGPPEFGAYAVYYFKNLPWHIIPYIVISSVYYVIDYARRVRERELQASKLEAQLSQAQLDVLKMQLHPHFLFNTLHAISALVHDQPDDADLMIGRLSDLLRLSLDNRDRHYVPLKEELDFLKIYLDIEKVRFQDRLRVNVDVDPDTLDILVPNLILQPLAENAVRHGISPRKEGGELQILAKLVDKRLHLEVADNGNGMDPEKTQRQKKGIGLSNTRARLEQMYGDSHLFWVRNGSDCGVKVTIELPVARAENERLTEEVES